MFMRSAICKRACFAAAHKISRNMAFERGAQKVTRSSTLRWAEHTPDTTLSVAAL